MSTKLRKELPHFKHSDSTERVYINTKQIILRDWVLWTGARVVDGCFIGLSLRSKKDRADLRRIGEKLIELADSDD